jgi:hypothetical protein
MQRHGKKRERERLGRERFKDHKKLCCCIAYRVEEYNYKYPYPVKSGEKRREEKRDGEHEISCIYKNAH